MVDQRKFVVFINPISGTKNSNNKQKIEGLLTEKKLNFEILPTKKDGIYEFLPTKITAEGISDIIICGGDGTVNQITKYLVGSKANVGIIPLGSGNGLALAAGISKNIQKAIAIILQAKTEQIDSFLINKQHSCMLCGIGFDAAVAHNFSLQKKRGLATYIKQSLKQFLHAKPYPFKIVNDNNTIHTHAFFISIANANQFGNNVTIAPKASMHDGLLDIVIVNKSSKLLLVYKLLQQIRNGKVVAVNNNKEVVHYFQTKKLTIYNPQLAPLHIDGEPWQTNAVFEIEIVEKAFSLLVA